MCMKLSKYTEFHTISNLKRRKNKMNLGVIDSSEMYCLSDFGGLHSNLKIVEDFSIHNITNKQKMKSSFYMSLERAFL